MLLIGKEEPPLSVSFSHQWVSISLLTNSWNLNIGKLGREVVMVHSWTNLKHKFISASAFLAKMIKLSSSFVFISLNNEMSEWSKVNPKLSQKKKKPDRQESGKWMHHEQVCIFWGKRGRKHWSPACFLTREETPPQGAANLPETSDGKHFLQHCVGEPTGVGDPTGGCSVLVFTENVLPAYKEGLNH